MWTDCDISVFDMSLFTPPEDGHVIGRITSVVTM